MAEDLDERERELAPSRMTVGEHLEELRTRLFRAILASVIGLVACLGFNQDIMALVQRPWKEATADLHLATQALAIFGPTQGFLAYVKVSLICGLIFTAPVWIYQIWAFIAAGLYQDERRRVYRFAPLCLLLFAGGVLFGYFVMIPIGLQYLLSFGDPTQVQPIVGLSEYLKVFVLLTLFLGVAFQLPIVLLGLIVGRVFTIATLRKRRRVVILVLFILAALFTPPDPATQVLLALPLVGLYELGLFLGFLATGGQVRWNGKIVWKRLRIVLILLLAAWLFREPLREMIAEKRVSDQVIVAGSEADRPVRGAQALLGSEVAAAWRGPREEDGAQLWLVRARGRLHVLRERSRRVFLQVRDRREGKVSYVSTPQGQLTFELDRAETVRWGLWVPALRQGLLHGDDTVQREARLILRIATGLPESGAPDEAVRFEKWLASRDGPRREQPARGFGEVE